MSLTKVSYSMITGAYVNVLDYGADPTNTTDSASAIQAALDTEKTVFIPDGVYNIKTTLKIYSNQALILSPGATIEAYATDLGTDPNTTLYGILGGIPRGYPMITNDDYDGGNEDIIIQGGKWTFFRDITIRAGAIIQLINVNLAVIENIYGFCSGIGLYTQNSGGFFAYDSQDISILNSGVYRSRGCHGIYVYQCPRTKIIGCTSLESDDSTYTINESPYSTLQNCYAFDSGGSHISYNSSDGIVQGNYIDMSGTLNVFPQASFGINVGHPSFVWTGNRTKVIGNTIVNNKQGAGIQVQEAPYTSNVVVDGNTLTATDTSTGNGISCIGQHSSISNNQISNFATGIYLYGEYNSVVGNQVYKNRSDGILVESKQNTIVGNVVYNNTGFGINVSGSLSDNNVINGNVCFDDQTPKTQTTGIRIVSGRVGNVISGNHCTGNSTTGIIIGSAGNVYGNNLIGSENPSFYVQAITTLDNTGTPSARNVSPVCLTGGTTSITNLLEGYIGQQITISANHNITIVNGATIQLSGSANFVMAPQDSLTLWFRGSEWYETARSVN